MTVAGRGGCGRLRALSHAPPWESGPTVQRAIALLHRPRYTLDGPGDGVALTFDDGPHPRHTREVLEVLDRRRAHATFFVMGDQVRRDVGLVREIDARGHALGSHSMTHPRARDIGMRALWRDWRDGHRVLEDALGRQVALFRPTHGHLDLRTGPLVRALGVTVWMWSLDPQDYLPGATPAGIDAAIPPTPGAVVLLHDAIADDAAAADRAATVAALDAVVARHQEAGIRLVTLPA